MIPAVNDCKRDVEFFERKTIFMFLYMLINEVGWTVALSKNENFFSPFSFEN